MKYTAFLILIVTTLSCDKPYENDLKILCNYPYTGDHHIQNMKKLKVWAQKKLKTESARNLAGLLTQIPTGECYPVLKNILPKKLECPLLTQLQKQRKRYLALKKMCYLPENIEHFKKIPRKKRYDYLVKILKDDGNFFLKRLARLIQRKITSQSLKITEDALSRVGIYQCPLHKRFEELFQFEQLFMREARSICNLPNRLQYLTGKPFQRRDYEDLYERLDGILIHPESRKLLRRYPTRTPKKPPRQKKRIETDPYKMIPSPKLLPRGWGKKPMGTLLGTIARREHFPCAVNAAQSPINLNTPYETIYPVAISFQPDGRFMGRCRSTIKNELKKKLEKINSCISPDRPFQGTLKSRWMVATSGKTISIDLKGGGKQFQKCLTRIISKWRFLPPAGLCQISGELIFTPNLPPQQTTTGDR